MAERAALLTNGRNHILGPLLRAILLFSRPSGDPLVLLRTLISTPVVMTIRSRKDFRAQGRTMVGQLGNSTQDNKRPPITAGLKRIRTLLLSKGAVSDARLTVSPLKIEGNTSTVRRTEYMTVKAVPTTANTRISRLISPVPMLSKIISFE